MDIHKKRFLDIFDIYHQFKHEDNLIKFGYKDGIQQNISNHLTSLFNYIKYAKTTFDSLRYGNSFDIRDNKYINELVICIPEIINKPFHKRELIQFLDRYHFYI